MKRLMLLIQVIAMLSVCLLFPGQIPAEELEIQVIVQKANIRARPDLNSEIIAQVSVGTVLKSDMKEGRWYRVILPPDEKGERIRAYIHDSIVEVVARIQEPEEKEKAREKDVPSQKKVTRKDRTARSLEIMSRPQRSDGLEFGLRLRAGPGFFIGQSTINDGWLGYDDLFTDAAAQSMGEFSLDGELEPLKSGVFMGGEVFFNIIDPYLGFGLGGGYISGSKEGILTATNNWDGSENRDVFSQKIAAPYVSMTVYSGLPLGKMMRVIPYLGGGLYFGKVTLIYGNEFDDPSILYEGVYDESWTARRFAFGLHGGLNFEMFFTRNIGLFAGVEGLLASFKNLEGDLDWTGWNNYGVSASGTDKNLKLWYVEADYSWMGLGEYPSYSLSGSEPSGIDVLRAEPGVVSLSQFRLVIGIVVSISR